MVFQSDAICRTSFDLIQVAARGKRLPVGPPRNLHRSSGILPFLSREAFLGTHGLEGKPKQHPKVTNGAGGPVGQRVHEIGVGTGSARSQLAFTRPPSGTDAGRGGDRGWTYGRDVA